MSEQPGHTIYCLSKKQNGALTGCICSNEFLEIAQLKQERNGLRLILQRKGYQENCDIAACNCGNQWNHGGHASNRLHEIADLVRTNGETLLGSIERIIAERDAALALVEEFRKSPADALSEYRARVLEEAANACIQDGIDENCHRNCHESDAMEILALAGKGPGNG